MPSTQLWGWTTSPSSPSTSLFLIFPSSASSQLPGNQIFLSKCHMLHLSFRGYPEWTHLLQDISDQSCITNFWTPCISSLLAAAVPKNWPYKKFMQHKLLQLQESGTTASISKRWERGTPVCQEEDDEDSLSLGPGETEQSGLPYMIIITVSFQRSWLASSSFSSSDTDSLWLSSHLNLSLEAKVWNKERKTDKYRTKDVESCAEISLPLSLSPSLNQQKRFLMSRSKDDG